MLLLRNLKFVFSTGSILFVHVTCNFEIVRYDEKIMIAFSVFNVVQITFWEPLKHTQVLNDVHKYVHQT